MLVLREEDQMVVQDVIRRGKSARKISRAHALNLRCKGYTVIETADILEFNGTTLSSSAK